MKYCKISGYKNIKDKENKINFINKENESKSLENVQKEYRNEIMNEVVFLKEIKDEDTYYKVLKNEINGFIKYFYLALKNNDNVKKSASIYLKEVSTAKDKLIEDLSKSMLKDNKSNDYTTKSKDVLKKIIEKAYKKNVTYEELKKEFENDEDFKIQIIKIVRRTNKKLVFFDFGAEHQFKNNNYKTKIFGNEDIELKNKMQENRKKLIEQYKDKTIKNEKMEGDIEKDIKKRVKYILDKINVGEICKAVDDGIENSKIEKIREQDRQKIYKKARDNKITKEDKNKKLEEIKNKKYTKKEVEQGKITSYTSHREMQFIHEAIQNTFKKNVTDKYDTFFDDYEDNVFGDENFEKQKGGKKEKTSKLFNALILKYVYGYLKGRHRKIKKMLRESEKNIIYHNVIKKVFNEDEINKKTEQYVINKIRHNIIEDGKISKHFSQEGGKKKVKGFTSLELEEIKAKEVLVMKNLTKGVIEAGNNLRILCGEYKNEKEEFWEDFIGTGKITINTDKLEKQKKVYGKYYLEPIVKEKNYKENVESITRFIMNIRQSAMHYKTNEYKGIYLSKMIEKIPTKDDKKTEYEDDKNKIKTIYDKFINKQLIIKDIVHKLLSTDVLKHYDEDDLLNIIMKGFKIENKDPFKEFPRYDKIKNILKDRFKGSETKGKNNEYKMEQHEIKLFEYVYNTIYRYEKHIKITNKILKKAKSESRESIVEEMRDKKYNSLSMADFYEEGQKKCGDNGHKLKQFNSYYNEIVGHLFFEFLNRNVFDGTTTYGKIEVIEVDETIENKKASKKLEDKRNRLEKKLIAKEEEINIVTIRSDMEYRIFALYLIIGNKNISSINHGFKKYIIHLEKIRKYREKHESLKKEDETDYNEFKESVKNVIEIGQILIDTKDKIKDITPQNKESIKKEIKEKSGEYFKEDEFMNYKITVDDEERGFYEDEKNLIKFNNIFMFEKYGQDSYLKNLLKDKSEFKVCKKDFETYEKYLNKKSKINMEYESEKIKACEEIVKDSKKNGGKNLIEEIIEYRNERLKEIYKDLSEIKEDKNDEKRKACIEKNATKYNEIVTLNDGIVEYNYYKNKIQFTLYKNGVDFIIEILNKLNAQLVQREKDGVYLDVDLKEITSHENNIKKYKEKIEQLRKEAELNNKDEINEKEKKIKKNEKDIEKINARSNRIGITLDESDRRDHLAHNGYFPDPKHSLHELIEFVFDELSYSRNRQTGFVESIKKVFERSGMEIKVVIKNNDGKFKIDIAEKQIKALSINKIKKIKPEIKGCKNAKRINKKEIEFYKTILNYKKN